MLLIIIRICLFVLEEVVLCICTNNNMNLPLPSLSYIIIIVNEIFLITISTHFYNDRFITVFCGQSLEKTGFSFCICPCTAFTTSSA